MVNSLYVEADLDLSIEDEICNIRANGDVITIEVPTFRALWFLQASAKFSKNGKNLLTSLQAMLTRTDLQVKVRLKDRLIATMGRGTKPGMLSYALDFAPLQLHAYNLLRAYFD